MVGIDEWKRSIVENLPPGFEEELWSFLNDRREDRKLRRARRAVEAWEDTVHADLPAGLAMVAMDKEERRELERIAVLRASPETVLAENQIMNKRGQDRKMGR